MLSIIGFLLSFGMGMTLGFIGAGGSILIVPILVYFFGIKPLIATGYSLLIVGLVALTGAIRYSRQHLVNISSAVIFALPAMAAVLMTRCLILPLIPDPLIDFDGLVITKDAFIMILFGFLMLAAAWFMYRRVEKPTTTYRIAESSFMRKLLLMCASSGVGFLTGLIGAGGGFLIVPTLTGLFKLPIKMAIGTSLTIIAMNSLVGFSGDLFTGFLINWVLLIALLFTTVLGMFLGTTLNQQAKPDNLNKAFAIFILIIGTILIGEQTFNICKDCFLRNSAVA